MIKKLQVSSENSKVIGESLYITAVLALSLKKGQKAAVDENNKVNFPGLGPLVKYNGEYLRK